ncbi:MAG: Omp28 family outer membrane lipoprotein [Muribaculaceae bacterium]|nr:Omp28 family outer membrane lipoprotein [Muribaculaceae bacterium]
MKKISLIAIGVAAFMSAGCSDIDSDDRFVELPAVEAQRTVLLEEFTGQYCVNCPSAHTVISNLLQQYPDNLISVSIHAGGDAFSLGEGQYDGLVGLRLPEGEAIAAMHGVKAYPAGVVNRTSGVLTSDKWAGMIREAVQMPSHLDLNVEAKLGSQGSVIEITADMTPYENIQGDLVVWVVESGITAMQIMPDGNVTLDYVHNHVFRGSVNGTGDPVNLVVREPKSAFYTVNVKPNWNVDNLSIVAFVATRNGVEQAAHCKVKK